MSLFRSEPVLRCQLILQSEAAYQCVAELGELEAVQFLDANPDVTVFNRKFVAEVKRCEEMERILRYISQEARRENLNLAEPLEQPSAPNLREIAVIESDLAQSEKTLSDLTNNYRALLKSQMELNELKNVLHYANHFLKDSDQSLQPGQEQVASMKFNCIAGVVDTSKLASFERILWRISKGNIFLKATDMEDPITDPATGDVLYKSLFLIFFQGEELRARAKKICEGYHASVYPCPDSATERREMLAGVEARLNDLTVVLKETHDHRMGFLDDKIKIIKNWMIQVRKMKATYHCLNMFNFDVSEKAMVAECWMPQYDIPNIKEVLKNAAEKCGSTINPILNEITVNEMPPTYNRVNKYTAGFQTLVDSYGANSYREVNPAVYTIATFPFLFAVMFGDAGHGTILLLFGLAMVMLEDKFGKKDLGEIGNIFFGGRYIITGMGAFSIYTGLIYNDIFAKSFNIFGSHWAWREDLPFTPDNKTNVSMEATFTLDPGNRSQYLGDPYYFGLDPVWLTASNKLIFMNGYKMKLSIIFGIIHMAFGISLSAWNKVIKRKYMHILLEVVPQIVFLMFMFGYLVFLMFFKWVNYSAKNGATGDDQTHSEHCAPNLLITFINMCMFKSDTPDEELNKICKGYETYMFSGQDTLQKFLVIVAVLMIPIMLLGKPFYERSLKKRQERQRIQRQQNDREHLLEERPQSRSSNPEAEDDEHAIAAGAGDNQGEEEPFSEIMIYQSIHTIEFVLGSVSHTASYLRLWALSLAHSQLSEVLWSMVMTAGFGKTYVSAIMMYFVFAFWAGLTLSILCLMEGLSAFLHTLRLHWVEFQSKFYEGQGVLFYPFSFEKLLKEYAEADKA